ncbi:MAG: Type III pantothenate kinase [Firmicutes bacterium ADurb.Bin153]|nr:MAG: Type III pantothenate kinase [Firmicutes bacterium ADurb.Bin153]
MLLAVDIGNTNIVVGLFDKDKLVTSFRIASERDRTADEYGILMAHFLEIRKLSKEEIDGAIISSVVPPLNEAIERAVVQYCGVEDPLQVGPGVKTGLAIKIENPKEVGADRVCDAVAVTEIYGAPAIVVDFGTATTFSAVDSEGSFIGGAIAPGVMTASDALFSKASKLPRVDIAKPKTVIGKSTVTAMQSGIFFGALGMVEEIVGRMKAEIGGNKTKVIATGGLAPLIASQTDTIDTVDPDITLKGLRIIYERNVSQ